MSEENEKKGQEYAVGYKKPPVATRFKPGQSGNPKGRNKTAKNFRTVIDSELNAQLVLTENGQRKKVSKRAAVAKQLVHKAIGGDMRATQILLNESRQAQSVPKTNPMQDDDPAVTPLTEEEAAKVYMNVMMEANSDD